MLMIQMQCKCGKPVSVDENLISFMQAGLYKPVCDKCVDIIKGRKQ